MYALVEVEFAPREKFSVIDVVVELNDVIFGGEGAGAAVVKADPVVVAVSPVDDVIVSVGV
jgi:hypothetical protein